ncbi:MAG: DUF309 domain-containing protein [Candidatus Caenarcaniphilales bacterium]|nr:DUF309 domain-containing protein [Candidatus Caenarcaniphilales bacterium]
MQLDEEQLETLNQGIELFNKGEFYEGHEFFEILWQQMSEDEDREICLFLVRTAAAGVHLTNGSFSSLFLYQLAYKQIERGLNLSQFNVDEIKDSLKKLIERLENCERAQLEVIAKETGLKLVFNL